MGSESGDGSGSLTAELADFLSGLTGSVEARLLAKVEDYLLDILGCIMYGATKPWSQAAAAHAVRTSGSGRSIIIGTPMGASPSGSAGLMVTPAMAAFANGAAAHAFELDDVHEEAISHPGAVVVPAALALAQELGSSGHDLLEAMVIGYEAMGRAGIAVGPFSHMLAGFHPTSMSGVFGSAAAAARLLELDGRATNHALGLAASMASGTMEFSASGGMAKRIHAARAAEAGLTAALLAADGLEGSTDGLAGRYGFCRIFTNEPHLDRLTERLGERWMIDEITVKPWAACSDIHPMIQATEELRDEHGITARMVERVEATGPTKAAQQNSLDGTTSVMAAQYSAQWNIAAALLANDKPAGIPGGPSNPETYHPDRIANPAIRAMQARVVAVRSAPEWDATYAWKMGGGVRITLADGSVVARSVHGQRGSMHQPLSRVEIEAKFTDLIRAAESALESGGDGNEATKGPTNAGSAAGPLISWVRGLASADTCILPPG